MSGHRQWSEARNARLTTAEEHAQYARAREALEQELAVHARTLGQVRRARRLTQQQLGMTMRVSQAQVSRIENQADLYLSTLRSYIEAMGGELQLRVAFPGGEWCEIAIDEATETASPGVSAASGSSGPPAANDLLDLHAAAIAEEFTAGAPASVAPNVVVGLPTAVFVEQPAGSPPSLAWLGQANIQVANISVFDVNSVWNAGLGATAHTLPPTVIQATYYPASAGSGDPAEPAGPAGQGSLAWLVQNGDATIPADSQEFIDSAPFRES